MQELYFWSVELCFYGFFQTALFYNMLEIEAEDGKTSWVAVNVKWSLSNELKQPEFFFFFCITFFEVWEQQFCTLLFFD